MLPTGGDTLQGMDTYPTWGIRKIIDSNMPLKGGYVNSLEGKCLVGEVFQTGGMASFSRKIPDDNLGSERVREPKWKVENVD